MSGLNHIGLSLTITFVISLVILLAEFLYVLWRRRVFHRQALRQGTMQTPASVGPGSNSQAFSDATSTCVPFTSYYKELLYFYFCINSSRISRVEPNSSAPPSLTSGESCTNNETMEVIDVFKLRDLYGPPRFLFTIKEEERENDVEYYSDKEKSDENSKKDSKRSVKLEECLKAANDEIFSSTLAVGLQIEEEEEEATGESAVRNECAIKVGVECETLTPPFLTPCESPSYYTPSASPVHQLQIRIAPSAANYCETEEDDFN